MFSLEQTCRQANFSSPELYRPFQLMIVGGIFYLSAALLTNLPPKESLAFISVAILINKMIFTRFAELIEPYTDYSLVPLIGQACHLTATVLIAKGIFHLLGSRFNFKQICLIGGLYLFSLYSIQLICQSWQTSTVDL